MINVYDEQGNHKVVDMILVARIVTFLLYGHV